MNLGVQDNLQLMVIFFPNNYIPFFWASEKKENILNMKSVMLPSVWRTKRMIYKF